MMIVVVLWELQLLTLVEWLGTLSSARLEQRHFLNVIIEHMALICVLRGRNLLFSVRVAQPLNISWNSCIVTNHLLGVLLGRQHLAVLVRVILILFVFELK